MAIKRKHNATARDRAIDALARALAAQTEINRSLARAYIRRGSPFTPKMIATIAPLIVQALSPRPAACPHVQ